MKRVLLIFLGNAVFVGLNLWSYSRFGKWESIAIAAINSSFAALAIIVEVARYTPKADPNKTPFPENV